jgi:ribosomal 50S subunit-recycling heat shock protein
MRLDLFLKTSRLITRRSLAQEFCDKGLVKVNGSAAKPSKEIKSGDEIELRRRHEIVRVRVLRIPEKRQMAKSDAASLFETLSVEKVEETL